MGFAAAVSQHPLTTQATGEVAGALLESVGPRPDLVAVFTTSAHAGALEDIAGAVAAVVEPLAVVGCSAASVIGPHREVEAGPAVVALAGTVGPLRPVVLSIGPSDGSASAAGPGDPGRPEVDEGEPAPGAAGVAVRGWPTGLPFEARTLLLFADPFSFPLDPFLRWMHRRHPDVAVVGGLPAGARGPGGSRLVSGTTVRSDGAVGVLLGPSVTVSAAVSQGCRPFGRPLVVTGAVGNVITELAGRPPLERLVRQAYAELGPGGVERLGEGGLRLGRVTDEAADRFGPGDFLVRTVLGVDRATGAIAVGDEIPLGTTVQFELVDPDGADVELRRALAGERADAALVFSGAGRGSRLFSRPDHDVEAVRAALGPVPTAGFFTVAELGPVHGGGNARHTMAATVAMLAAPAT